MTEQVLHIPYSENFEHLGGFAMVVLEEVPWLADYPYKPVVKLFAAHNRYAMLLRFEVEEDNVKALCLSDNGPVWEDSCVEFFVKTPDSPYYFNFETNCIGTGLAAKRLNRKDSTHFHPEMMKKVLRKSSLPAAQLDTGKGRWTLELTVPFDVLDCGPKPEQLLANFYKCGDKTSRPHFLSWASIDAPTPDFHRPEFFGKLELQW